MAKKIVYNKIYGCPKHGNKHGEVVMLKSKENGVEVKKPCFRCDACKIAYLEPSSGPIGSTKHSVKHNGNPIEIWHTVGPLVLPKSVVAYEKNSGSKLCSCEGRIKDKTKSITHFLLPDGTTLHASGAKVCKTCKKVFVTTGMLKALKVAFDEYGVEIINERDIKDENVTSNTSNEISLEKHFNVEWENAVFDDDEDEEEIFSIEELKPAGKVASAYYDAKIRYNPYQYLPWLKMYVNGANKLLISDEVGLGKTIEAGILIMEELTENINGRVVILCPAFLREKWYHELKDKFLIEAQVYDGKTVIDSSTSVVILPISRIKQYLEKGGRTNFDMVIVDEVHYFKNASSRRYSQLKKLLEEIADAKYVFMSATPINNSGNDYRSIERLFGCNPDRTNTTKKQAYISLPERHIEDVYVELTAEEQNFYDATDILDPFSGTIYRHIGASCLYALSKYAFAGEEKSSETKEELRAAIELLLDGMEPIEEETDYFETIKAMSLPEVDSKMEALKHIVEKYEAGTKIVIFSHYIETVKYLHSVLGEKCNVGYVYANNISNNIPCKHAKNKFEDAKEWFVKSEGKTTILICSDSCREGIDLDVANVLINYDLPFNPSILEQRIGRIDRMSQKNNMEIYNFHVNNTYDDRLHFILSTKLRFINFYADYGIGNPLNITADGNSVLDSFIRYFGQQFHGTKSHTLMSNDDFYVASKLLRKIGIKIEKKDDLTSIKMQAILLDRLQDNQEEIVKWFDKGELKRITDEQLYKQRDDLDKILGFPSKIERRIVLDNVVLESVVIKANENVQFRRRIAPLIKGYADKLVQMEITGNPMHIDISDFDEEYVFGVNEEDKFIQSSVIEVMRKEGAKVYEIN